MEMKVLQEEDEYAGAPAAITPNTSSDAGTNGDANHHTEEAWGGDVPHRRRG
jgi:hypothetical protein